MKGFAILPLLVVGALVSTSVIAAPQCTDAARDKWLPEATIKQQIVDSGYTIDVFKVSGNCYEIYGKDAKGQKVEIYFDPTDGRIVKQRGGGKS